ncbi:MAG TPA: hypothetical protein VD907_01505 [Verrucomicrobiae bacterium]|nr:hypothetical protein [Verrucomicrobiae bacterium]
MSDGYFRFPSLRNTQSPRWQEIINELHHHRYPEVKVPAQPARGSELWVEFPENTSPEQIKAFCAFLARIDVKYKRGSNGSDQEPEDDDS